MASSLASRFLPDIASSAATLALFANVFAKHRDVDVLGETLDKAEALRQRCPPFEEKARSVGRRTVEQRVKGPTNPEILLDILRRSAQPLAGANEHIAAINGSAARNRA